MPRTRLFGPREMNQVGEALWVAENSVSDFFRVSEGFWRRHPYELRTLADLSPREISPRALAQVLRFRQAQAPGYEPRRDFFRVCLQDHNLLRVLQRENDGQLFLPLMIYVLSHELVHVVRFAKFQHLFDASPKERAVEEKVVHKLTGSVLQPLRIPHMGRVLELYQEHGDDQWMAAS